MGVYIGKNMGEAYEDGKIQHPSQAVTYIDNVCEKCGHHMSYPHWATNGYTCIRCGYTEKQKTHSEVEDEVKQPVTWQEAIQAWVEGKTVTVLTLFGLGSREVKKSRGSSITEYEITNGVWYVED